MALNKHSHKNKKDRPVLDYPERVVAQDADKVATMFNVADYDTTHLNVISKFTGATLVRKVFNQLKNEPDVPPVDAVDVIGAAAGYYVYMKLDAAGRLYGKLFLLFVVGTAFLDYALQPVYKSLRDQQRVHK